MNNYEKLKTGGDPRALPDYVALCDELARLSHPARPDMDWLHVERLCLSLFRQNGVELFTASWYTLARTHLAGITGLNEGLSILESLLRYQWRGLWPQPVQAREEIFSAFSQRLKSLLRTQALNYIDLAQIYQAEQHFNTIREVLQRLAFKNASQLGELCTFMHNAATRIENIDGARCDKAAVIPSPANEETIISHITAPVSPLVYIACEEPSGPYIFTAHSKPRTGRPWKAFVAGMVTMLITVGTTLWGWAALSPVSGSVVPVAANKASLKALEQMSPLWRQDYGFSLAERARHVERPQLKAQWQNYIAGNALAPELLSGWHYGMKGLGELARRLNTLDERRGKYMTGSELKTMVFAITQDFSRAVPLEEQLWQLSQTESGVPLPAVQLMQTDMHFNQLLNRYMLIQQNANNSKPTINRKSDE